MFEQEIEMEKKESSIVPLLLIVALIIAVVGVSLYFVLQSRKILTAAEATPIIQNIVENQGPVMLHIVTGTIKANPDVRPRDPHYRLLERAGYITVGKERRDRTPVSLTPAGKAFLAEIQGVKQEKDKDGYDNYSIPLAQRKLVSIGKITMTNPSLATVEYAWKWETTKAGDMFDASGPNVKAFNTWERSTLIDKYGANFYHAAPTRVAISLVKSEKGWQINND